MAKEIDDALQADEKRRELVALVLAQQPMLRAVSTSSFLLITRDLTSFRNENLSLKIYPTIRHFCLRIHQFPQAIFIVQDFSTRGLDRAKLEFAEISVGGGVRENELFYGLAKRMFNDWWRPRVLVTAGLLLVIAVPAILARESSLSAKSSIEASDIESLQSVLGSLFTTAITVGAAYLAIFALYSGLSQATVATKAEDPSEYALHSYNAERVMLGWVLVSIGLAVSGQFLGLGLVTYPYLRFLVEALGALSVITLVPPLVDVIPYFVARNYDLLLMQSVASEIRGKAAHVAPEEAVAAQATSED